MNRVYQETESSSLIAHLRSSITLSISVIEVCLPTLSLMAFLATSSGIPHDNSICDGLSPRSEWQAAPTLACKYFAAAMILRPLRLEPPRNETLHVFGKRLPSLNRLLKRILS